MNLVGKIFVVLILVASCVFMTLGLMIFATHQNWRAAIITPKTGYQDQLKTAYTDSAKLSNDIEKLVGLLSLEKAAHQQELAKAETALAKAEEHKADLEKAVQDERNRLDTVAKSLEVAQASLTALRKENGGLREDIRDANKKVDEQVKIATEMEDKLHIALGQLSDLKKRNEQISNQYAAAVVILRKLRPDMNFSDTGEIPMLRGEILAIDKDDRVEVSLGSDDGLREGNTLEVYRGDKYLGRMQILEAQPHRAIGMILKEYKVEPIRKGDSVASKLKV